MPFQQNQQELILNSFTRSIVNKNGDFLFLTAKEFDLLYFLYLHKGQVFTKEQLYENVWGFENMPNDTSNLPSFIRKLRKKIEPDPDKPKYIITVWGVGYKFSDKL
ncbi:winged helix-turn-helix domain-containing protein [Thomasclavelia spiroformis]|uniref:winged helix-turn-helix domain-containing protein n=1 Tax=Thomasclavelia spiroformis TaxID=29348 RepID=UPI0039A09A9D